MTADEFNALYPVGTPVVAYPLVRPEHPVAVKFREAVAAGRSAGRELDPCERLDTRTRSIAWNLDHGVPVVLVEGYMGGICLTHVDVVDGGGVMAISDFLAALSGGDLPADAVREGRCLNKPIGCGEPLTARVFGSPVEAAQYEAEWHITGLCADCQDRLDDEGGGDDE